MDKYPLFFLCKTYMEIWKKCQGLQIIETSYRRRPVSRLRPGGSREPVI